MITYFDGEFIDDSAATISVRSRGLNYGLGCFGGVRGYADESGEQVYVFRLDDHMKRLEQSARMLYLSLGDRSQATAAVTELLRRNEVKHDIYVRPMVFSNSNQLSPVLREEDSCVTIYCLPLQRYMAKDAIDVCISSWRRVADNAIPARAKPTGIYLNSALARREASNNGFDEAILLTEAGLVSEGSAEHIFMIRDGVLYSPPSTQDNLDGITRRSLITLATEDLGITFVERPIARTELYVADEILLCGTGAEVQPVASVDRRAVGNGGIGEFSKKLRDHFGEVVRGRVEHRKNWLTPVW